MTTAAPESSDEVSNFYQSIRDYWAELSRSPSGEYSHMLNFGYWAGPAPTLHHAQKAFVAELMKPLRGRTDLTRGLEVGCGIGGVTIEVLKSLPWVTMTALDISPEQLRLAANHAQQAGCQPRVAWREGSSMAMPFADGAFDFTLCIESTFHYPDKPRFFAENFRVIRPGGLSVVADITCEDTRLVLKKKGNHFESRERYRRMAESSGLEVVAMTSIGRDVYPPLLDCIRRFNTTHRSAVGKYWSMVMSNYRDLGLQGVMDYVILSLRKPGPAGAGAAAP